MSKQPFMPKLLDARRTWLNHFVDTLQTPANGLAAKYNVPAGAITTLDLGRQWFNWTRDNLAKPRNASTTLTAFKDNLISGDGPLTIPGTLAYSTPPAGPPVGGVFALAGSIGAQIKSAYNYDPADGVQLGLEGTEEQLPDAATTAPDLTRSGLTSGGMVEVDWAKGPFDGVRIEVDRGDGKGFIYLATDTAPNYIDTVKPAPGTVAIYRYRAIYLHDEADYGQWSQPTEITVRG